MAVFHVDLYSNTIGRIIPMTAIVPIERQQRPGGPKAEMPAEPFRALYLLHGYNGADTDWIRGSRIGQLAMEHNRAVFMPAGENSFYLDDPIRNANYSQLICEELIAFTRAVFPVSTRCEDTYLGGFSMGGYGALRNGFFRSDVFHGIIALSSAMIVDMLPRMKAMAANNSVAPVSYYEHTFGPLDEVPGSDRDPKALAKRIIDEQLPRPHLFMACGTEDFGIESNRQFSSYLNEIGYEHEFYTSPGVHNWAFWDEYIEKALHWIDGLTER